MRTFKAISFVFSAILLNLIISYKVKDFLLVDYSRNSFTHETIKVLSELKSENKLKINVFYDEESKVKLSNIFSLVQNYMDNVEIHFFDADFHPEKIQSYNINKVPSSVFEFQGRMAILEDHSELNLINGILNIFHKTKKRVIFLTGQGQPSLSDTSNAGIGHLTERLNKKIFDIITLDLLGKESIGRDDLVISVGQTRDFNKEELKKIRNAGREGADFAFFIDPFFSEDDRRNLNDFLKEYDLELKPGYLKLNEDFVNGSNGLAPMFSNLNFFGKNFDRAFFPFSTPVFSGEKTTNDKNLFIGENKAVFLNDINMANKKNIKPLSKSSFFLSYKSDKKFHDEISSVFVLGNATFLQNKFKSMFDTNGFFSKVIESTAKDNVIKSLNIPFNLEQGIFLEKRVNFLTFFSFIIFSLLIFIFLSKLYLKPKKMIL